MPDQNQIESFDQLTPDEQARTLGVIIAMSETVLPEVLESMKVRYSSHPKLLESFLEGAAIGQQKRFEREGFINRERDK